MHKLGLVVLALAMNMPIAAFAQCGKPGLIPGGDNCGLTGGSHNPAPGPIVGGGIVGLAFGGLWLWRKLRKN